MAGNNNKRQPPPYKAQPADHLNVAAPPAGPTPVPVDPMGMPTMMGPTTGQHLAEELVWLLSEYDKLVEALESGELQPAAARSTLSALTVLDAAGFIWGVDEHRRFVRAASPDETPVVADPAEFAPRYTAVGSGLPESPQMTFPGGKPSRRNPLSGLSGTVKAAVSHIPIPNLAGVDRTSRVRFGLIGLAAVLLVYVVSARSCSGDTTPTDGTSPTGNSTPTEQVGPDGSTPTSTGVLPAFPSASTPDDAPPIPTATVPELFEVTIDDALAVVNVLSSGDTAAAYAVVPDLQQRGNTGLLTIAEWVGLRELGATYEVASYATNSRRAEATVVATVDGVKVAAATIKWEAVEGEFVVDNSPTVSALR